MKRVAILNFHPAFAPPKSGGELRYWNLSTRLARRFDVRMVNPTFGEAQREEIRHADHCVETRIPKTRAYNGWHAFFDKYAKFRECSALVSTLAVKSHRDYLDAAARAASEAEIVVHASPFVAAAYPKAQGGKLLVYDAYNVEATLARESFGRGFWADRAVARIRRVEGALCRNAHLILACSREDADEFQDVYGVDGSKIAVVPNGADLDGVRPASPQERAAARERLGLSERPAFLFLGSFHPPNIEALDFLLRDLAPGSTAADFLIAGKVCEAARDRAVPANVRLLGVVDDATKRDLLAACDGALNPMFSGSGTNLKMLEFLAAGLPTIATPVGARGLDLRNGEQALVVQAKYFAKGITDLIADPARLASLRAASRAHVEDRFSWDAIGESLADLLDLKLGPRILMLNDYPMTPATSGGRIRVEAVGHALAESVAPVTLLSLTKEKRGRHLLVSPIFEELNVPRSRLHNLLDRLLALPGDIAVDDATAAAFPHLAPAYRRAVAREARNADLVVLNHCYMVHHAALGKAPILYESHNVETVLKERLYPKTRIGRLLLDAVRRAERTALAKAARRTCVSEEDRRVFAERFGIPAESIAVADNGIASSAEAPLSPESRIAGRALVGIGREPVAVFLGSGHPPNADAARFIVRELAPACPAVTFLIVGSVCGWFRHEAPPANVAFMGEVSVETKSFLLATADIALNPLLQGAGSSLKVPEYLNAGLPVVTTTVGARGFVGAGDSPPEPLLVRDLADFAAAVRDLAGDPALRGRLGAEGWRLARERFDWSIALGPLVEAARPCAGARHFSRIFDPAAERGADHA